MLLMGIDAGTSSIKVSVIDSQSQRSIAAAQFPEAEAEIIALQPGWAEQSPELWWEHTKKAIQKCNAQHLYDPKDIIAIGISYQMHGLVLVDKQQQVLRDAIIWCDGRAVNTGDKAFNEIGRQKCLSMLLNSPGNFTASKLAWVKENEPALFERIEKVLLPGDFLAMKFTGEITTTVSALSEAILWDFKNDSLSADVMHHFGFNPSLIPEIRELFSSHGRLTASVAAELSLQPGIVISYKAGDQLNNAFALNVMNPGEIAANAGTSGVIYAVSDSLDYDPESRVNSFAHVNHTKCDPRIGVLMCINGTGISNKWIKNLLSESSYESLNAQAAQVNEGAEGVLMLPFGNGPERMLKNRNLGAHIHGIDLNRHGKPHLARAVQEGIAFAFRYGLDIMKENGIRPSVIRTGYANLFLSDVFSAAFADATGLPVEIFETDGSVGAALGAGAGAGIYRIHETFSKAKIIKTILPGNVEAYDHLFNKWKSLLENQIT